MLTRRPLLNALKGCHPAQCISARFHAGAPRPIQIRPTPSIATPDINTDLTSAPPGPDANPPDAQFEVLGAPYSLLSVSLSASQNLYTRRGTLVGVTGKAENAVSTLSILEPFRRAILGIPFLYQRVSSTSPLTALISTKSPLTSFAVVRLDGTLDWMVAQRSALLAWTGHSLSVRPTINRKMSLAYWGNSEVTGRGLLALVGMGQVYRINLEAGEEFVVHPSNIVAYAITQHPPLPYRLRSSSLRFQMPSFDLSPLIPDTKFIRVMRESATWKTLRTFYFNVRTWSRRTIWGDRLFVKFHGPSTLLLQTRAARVSDVLSTRDVNELAETPPGAAQSAVTLERRRLEGKDDSKSITTKPRSDTPIGLSVASIGRDGKVHFQPADDFKSFTGQ